MCDLCVLNDEVVTNVQMVSLKTCDSCAFIACMKIFMIPRPGVDSNQNGLEPRASKHRTAFQLRCELFDYFILALR